MLKRALLIGISDYPFLNRLEYAEADTEAFYKSMQEYYGFEPEEIVLMTSESDIVHCPLRQMIERQFRQLREYQNEIDLLIIGFWGQAFKADGMFYLCTADTEKENIIKTSISFDDFVSSIAQIGARNTCFIFDYCQKAQDCCTNTKCSRESENGLTINTTSLVQRINASRRNKGITTPFYNFAILDSCGIYEVACEGAKNCCNHSRS